MREATICFVMMLCSVVAFGQQQPQWKVVQSVALFNQTNPIPPTTLLTPTEPGAYRVSLYFSGVPKTAAYSNPVVQILGSDITGASIPNWLLQLSCNVPNWLSIPATTISLKPQVPLIYELDTGNSSSCLYNLIISVEQLVQQ